MLLYDAICPLCKRQYEYSVATSDDRNDTPVCCGVMTVRALIKPQMGHVDNPAYMYQYKHLYAGKG